MILMLYFDDDELATAYHLKRLVDDRLGDTVCGVALSLALNEAIDEEERARYGVDVFQDDVVMV